MTVSIYQRASETSYAVKPTTQPNGAVLAQLPKPCTLYPSRVDVTTAVKKFIAQEKPKWTETQVKTKIQEIETEQLAASMPKWKKFVGMKPKAKPVESVNLNMAKTFINALLPEGLKAQIKTASQEEQTQVSNVINNTAPRLLTQFAEGKQPKLSVAEQIAIANKPRAMGTGF